MKDKYGQIWYTDFMIGLLIFVIVIFIYYGFAYSINQRPSEVTNNLLLDAKAVSSALVTAGSPIDWNASTVSIIGLTDGNQRLVQFKLDQFANLTYAEGRSKLRIPYDFYVFFESMNGSRLLIDGQEGIGKPITSSENAVSLTRVVVHNNSLMRMAVQIWQ